MVHGRPMGWIPLKKLIEKAQPLSSAKYVKFISFDDPEEAPGMKIAPTLGPTQRALGWMRPARTNPHGNWCFRQTSS